MQRIVKTLALVTTTLTLTACGGPFSDYSGQDLRAEFRKCDYSKLSPAGAQRCRNIEKECKKRTEETGFRC